MAVHFGGMGSGRCFALKQGRRPAATAAAEGTSSDGTCKSRVVGRGAWQQGWLGATNTTLGLCWC